MRFPRPLAALVVIAVTAAPVLAGSPEADREFERGMWFCCCGLPLIFGALMVMIAAIAIKDARERKP